MNEQQIESSGKTSKLLLPVSIIIAGVLIAGALMYKPGAESEIVPVGDARKATLSIDDDAVLGDVNAPVTMIIFGDFQCPFCKQQFDTVESRLREEYVKTGKLRMVHRDFPLENIHPFATPAAIAAQCAGAQGKYWEYHDALFEKQSELPKLDFSQLAGSLQLDTTAFGACLKNPATAAEVKKDLEDGINLGISGTPASFVNNVFIEGAYPYDSFKKAIDDELAKK